MLQVVRELVEKLDGTQVRYCHWKSNATLDAAVDGVGDLDILVHPLDLPSVEGILAEAGFVEAVVPEWRARPGAKHYYGMDGQSGVLVHIDLYGRLLTGGTLLKNHHLPLEEMVFSNLRRQSSVPVPSRAAELLLLVIRKMLECASVPEYALLTREYAHILSELRWLTDEHTRAEAHSLLRRWLPLLEPELFDRCLEALADPRAVAARFWLGRRLARQVRDCSLLPATQAELARWGHLGRWGLNRLRIGPRGVPRARRGIIVAFVGPEGSGKSTMARETGEWLGEAFAVRSMHVGKPPASPVGVVLNLLAPTMRALLPGYRTNYVGAGRLPTRRSWIGVWLYSSRCLGLAFDRWLLLNSARQARANGVIVLCDRYPFLQTGFVDSPQLRLDDPTRLASWMARLEHRLYRTIPRPDLVINCEVPLEEALRRNASRHKKGGPEPEDFVRSRHAQFRSGVPSAYQAHTIDTARPREETRLRVRQLVWQTLRRAVSSHVGDERRVGIHNAHSGREQMHERAERAEVVVGNHDPACDVR